jgi:hypothetical protein
MAADRRSAGCAANHKNRSQLTDTQVAAAFETAGLVPVAPTAVVAQIISSQLRATEVAFACIPFAIEPASFLLALIRERA